MCLNSLKQKGHGGSLIRIVYVIRYHEWVRYFKIVKDRNPFMILPHLDHIWCVGIRTYIEHHSELWENIVMEWVKEIFLGLRVEYVTDSSAWFCNPDTDCFCDIRRKSWPFNSVSRDNGLSVKIYPRVNVRVSYFSTRNSSKQAVFSLNCDVLQMNSMTHQCVIEQVRSSIALAKALGKRIVVSKQLARAAK